MGHPVFNVMCEGEWGKKRGEFEGDILLSVGGAAVTTGVVKLHNLTKGKKISDEKQRTRPHTLDDTSSDLRN